MHIHPALFSSLSCVVCAGNHEFAKSLKLSECWRFILSCEVYLVRSVEELTMQSGGISKHRGRGAPTPSSASTDEEVRHDEGHDGALGNLLSFVPPAVRDWLGVSGAAITCCVSSRPPEIQDTSAGECGVGLILEDCSNPTYNNYNVFVKALSVGGPAESSKQIQEGDVLVKIDGKDVIGMKTKDLGQFLIGPVGSAVSLQMRRGSNWKGGEGKVYSVDLNRKWACAGLKEIR